MRWKFIGIVALMATVELAFGQASLLIVNPAEAKWTHGPRDPAGAESVMVREDAATGGMELLVRYAAGHVFTPHWHASNERIVLIEGRLSLKQGDAEHFVEAGGLACLPAREVQRMSCVSKTRCMFYVSWDGNPAPHPAAEAK